MKKQKKICRRKGADEVDIDLEHQKQVNALATQFKEDQLKAVLQKCYSNVQKYGPEAILKAVEDSWTAVRASATARLIHNESTDKDAFIQMKEAAQELMNEELELLARSHSSTPRSHEETSKQNALFLIESSEALDYYDSDTLAEMKQAYDLFHYDDVADWAYLHDRARRPQPRGNDDTALCCEEPHCMDRHEPQRLAKDPWCRILELLTEVAGEDQSNKSPLKCCVEAVRCLSRDLTYDNRVAAKTAIREAIKYLEEE